MRTSIQIADTLIRQVRRETGAATLSGAIRSALEQFLLQRKRVKLIKSFGRFPAWNPNVRRMRKNRALD
ncbi:MAG: type II toxin-antitoxin system VapB family antitoxin [Deltaproteobacteria bacterium]|nr:type II toxin-antitoxin system VapB family antitoxin [Deltaproteobacteria bacterium]